VVGHTSRSSSTAQPLRELLLHPILIGGLALWLMNDHMGKHAFPTWWSGKLSDAAGLAVFPVVLAAALEPLWRRSRAALLWTAACATGSVLLLINTWDVAAESYRWGLGALQWPFRLLAAAAFQLSAPTLLPVQLTMDPTDAVTLPFAAVGPYLHHRLAPLGR
jgi:hypothetical protein